LIGAIERLVKDGRLAKLKIDGQPMSVTPSAVRPGAGCPPGCLEMVLRRYGTWGQPLRYHPAVQFMTPKVGGTQPVRATVDIGFAKGAYMHSVLGKTGVSYEADVSALLVSLGGSYDSTVFIDIGANISYFPVLMGAIFGECFVMHTFEPMPMLYEMGVQGLKDNKLTATTSQEALSDHVGVAEFHLSAATDSSNSLNPTFRESVAVIEVKLSTLDQVFLEEKRCAVTAELAANGADNSTGCVLVIDTESTEPDVLAGGDQLIATIRPHIICEVLAGRTEDRIQSFIERHEYHAYRLSSVGLHLEDKIFGDPTYQHRDWYLAPSLIDESLRHSYHEALPAFLAPDERRSWRRLLRK
jgi:FkbM family methyltransferase